MGSGVGLFKHRVTQSKPGQPKQMAAIAAMIVNVALMKAARRAVMKRVTVAKIPVQIATPAMRRAGFLR